VAYAPAVDSADIDEILVDFTNEATRKQIRSLEKKYRLRLLPNSRFSWTERLFRGRLDKARILDLLQKLRREPLVERAELDEIYSIPPLESAGSRFSRDVDPGKDRFPNDPKYPFQWHLDQIGMPQAWPKATGKGTTVAVIDTGVAYANRGTFKRVPDLAKTSFVAGYDFVNDTEHPLDDHGHGTHVAGTIAQSTNNGIGVAGTAYRARIMPLKVLNSRGFGNIADIAEAVRFAADRGAKIINMSLGSNRSSKILGSAVKYARNRGVVVVCAAGNNGQGKVSYPAAFPGVIGVAATQFDRTTTFYSNWGPEIDLAAPGGNTRVDQNGDGMPDGVLQNTILPGRPAENDYLLFMGTSMASPHVAGAAALVMQQGVTEPDAVERLLTSTARHPQDKRRDERYGAGIVDVGAALDKSTTSWGGYKLVLSSLLGLLVLGGLRGRGQLGIRPGTGTLIGLVLGSTGLFFLQSLGLVWPVGALISRGLPAWDLALFGQATPLFHSLLIPLGAVALLYGVPRLRGFLFSVRCSTATTWSGFPTRWHWKSSGCWPTPGPAWPWAGWWPSVNFPQGNPLAR
jgi:serine protease